MASFVSSETSVRRESENHMTDEMKKEKALKDAAACGRTEKLSNLLESGVNVDAKEMNDALVRGLGNPLTPLQLASAEGHPECVRILIAHGADRNARDRNGMTALHFAAKKGNVECIQKLLQAGANCRLETFVDRTLERCFGKPYVNGTTALHIAVANNHVECAKMLINYGADYNAVDELERNSLYIAAESGFTECVAAHLDIHHHPPLLSFPSRDTGNTPLHFAVRHGMQECVRKLAILGSDVNHINYEGFSPLHLAASSFSLKNRVDILKILVKEGYKPDVNLSTSPRGFKPLHYFGFNARIYGLMRDPDVAKFLISYGADVNITFGYRSLLECELNSPTTDYGLLKYIVRSMHRLPSLDRRIHQSQIRDPDFYPEFYIPIGSAVNDADLPPNIVEKWSWYNELVAQIPTLKHSCRYVIRKSLGTHGLARIEQLTFPFHLRSSGTDGLARIVQRQIPKPIRSYLLLDEST